MNKQKIILISALFIGIIAVVSIFYIFEGNKNTYGDEVEIVNLSQYTKGQPSDKLSLDFIKYSLLNVINMNSNDQLEGKSISDASIRDGSFSQKHNTETNVNSVKFIVDILSLKQSYQVSYEWSSDENNDNIDEYGTLVTCLPEEKLIFAPFNCKDSITELSKTLDPIVDHLPYSTPNYRVTYDDNFGSLNIEIYTSAADERGDSSAAVEIYSNQSTEWIKSIGSNPDDYNINYSVVRASLY